MFLQLYLGVVVFKACLFYTQSNVTRQALDKNVFCPPPPALHTQHLNCVSDRVGLVFAATDFKPSNVQFNIRCST